MSGPLHASHGPSLVGLVKGSHSPQAMSTRCSAHVPGAVPGQRAKSCRQKRSDRENVHQTQCLRQSHTSQSEFIPLCNIGNTPSITTMCTSSHLDTPLMHRRWRDIMVTRGQKQTLNGCTNEFNHRQSRPKPSATTTCSETGKRGNSIMELSWSNFQWTMCSTPSNADEHVGNKHVQRVESVTSHTTSHRRQPECVQHVLHLQGGVSKTVWTVFGWSSQVNIKGSSEAKFRSGSDGTITNMFERALKFTAAYPFRRPSFTRPLQLRL